MRRSPRRTPLMGCAVAVAAVLAFPGFAHAAPRIVISSLSEPPDTQVRGGKWRVTATVANEGSSRAARGGTLAFYLSLGRRFSADDLRRKMGSDLVYRRLGRGEQVTRRGTLQIPSTTPDGSYYLVSCIGAARVGTDNVRCRFSGQAMVIGARPLQPGTVGPKGDKGDKGDPGAPGNAQQVVTIARRTLDTGFANIENGSSEPRAVPADPTTDVNAEEGSTQMVDLATVGPFTFTALCREGMPGEPFNSGEAGNDEAKILVTHNADGQTMALRGIMGARANVPAGRGTAGADNALGGEGQHQIIAAARQRDEGFSTLPADNDFLPDAGDLDTTPDPDRGSGGTNPTEAFVSGFSAGSAFITHSGGYDVIFNGYAGIDVLGAGTPDNLPGQNYPDDDENDKTNEDDRCVFGGSVTVVNAG